MQKGGPATNPKELARRLEALVAKWKVTVEKAEDAKLRFFVQKASDALADLADSAGGGKKISVSDLQNKLKSADAGLRKACPKSVSGT